MERIGDQVVKKEVTDMADEEHKEEIKQEDKLFAALSYPLFLPALFLIFTDKKNVHFCRYHGWQGLFFGLAMVLLGFCASILAAIPGIGCILAPILGLLPLVMWVFSIFYAIKAYNGEYVVIPVVTDFAKPYIEGK
ncbi:MAG: DUF4870 domain-containing protein [Candidatus Eremiobacteraeota bacterium]|nr:DUF4870 domain-containing protein [Candidatus Eremiobacteraeota bacterium]